MNPLVSSLRTAAQSQLPEGAFLRRDRGEALFVTDAPRRGGGIDWTAAGFLCREENSLAHLTPDGCWLDQLEAQFPEPPDALCEGFKRFSGAATTESLLLFARAMKRLDGGAPDPGYNRALRQRAAVCLRRGEGGGGLYACAIANFLIERMQTL